MATIGLSFEHHSGNAPCVTLLHGFPLDRAMWHPTIQSLRRGGYRVLAPDLRGFGHSEPLAPATIADMAADVVAVWDALAITDAVVVGFSMGGYVAMHLALHHPERVSGLVLVDTRAEADTPEAREARRTQADDLVQRQAPAIETLADQMLGKQLTPQSQTEPLGTHVREIMLRQGPAGLATALRAMGQRDDMRTALQEIDVPSLVVVGSEDPITPRACAEALVEGLPQARLVEVEGAAHLVPMERPEPWNTALQAFLGAHWGRHGERWSARDEP